MDTTDDIGLTPLYYAAFRGDHESVKILLESGADVNPYHRVLGTPIMIAALRGHMNAAERLLQHKASLASRTHVLGSALHCAYFSGVLEIVQLIIKRAGEHEERAIVSLDAMAQMADEGLSPSHVKRLPLKVWQESRDVAYSLPEPDRACFSSEWHKKHRIRCPPVLLAVEREHYLLLDSYHCSLGEANSHSHADWELVDRGALVHKSLLMGSAGRASSSARGSANRSAASKASSSGGWSLMGFPHDDQIEIDRSVTLLMWAAASLNPGTVDRILRSGVDVTTKDRWGRTALHYVALPFRDADFGDTEACVRLLAKAGANFNAMDSLGNSPLTMALSPFHPSFEPQVSWRRGSDLHEKCVKAFLYSDAETSSSAVYSRETLGRALMSAMHETDPETGSCCDFSVIRLLCDHGAPADFKDEHGRTVIGSALARGADCAMITLLLERGADVRGDTQALHTALRSRAPAEVIEKLLEHGADPNAANGCFREPLLIAAEVQLPAAIAVALLKHGADCDSVHSYGASKVATYLRRLNIEVPAEMMSKLDNQATKKPSNDRAFWLW